jgi:hypothetical protein
MATVSRTKTWSTGETLTAAALNAEFDGVLSGVNSNSLNQANLSKTDDYTFGSVIIGTGITSADGGQLHVYSGTGASVVAHTDADEGVFESSGNAGISILAGATSNSAVYFGDTDNDIAKIDYDHASNDFLFASGGTITLDAETDIVLDANGADIFLYDAGTVFGKLINNSGELRIASGSSSTTALSFAGANATFAGTVGSGAITSTGIVKTDDTTEATSTTDGSLQTDGGLSVAKDAIFGDDVRLLSDSAILSLGAGNDAALTHDGTTGVVITANPITITSGGAATWSTSSGALTVTSAANLNLNPASGSVIELDGTINIDAGVVTGATSITLSGELDAGSLDISGNADIAGDLTLSAGADGALQFTNAGENSIKIPDNQASALIIEEADAAYLTFVTTNSGEKITLGKKLEAGSVEIEGSAFDVNGGNIDGTVIGAASAAAGTFTTITGSDDASITSADNLSPIFLVENTHANGNSASIDFYKNSSSVATYDGLGTINFYGKNAAGTPEKTKYAYISAAGAVITDGSESGQLDFVIIKGGSNTSAIRVEPTEVVFNDNQVDMDFRVESDDNANAFFIEGATSRIGIGTGAPGQILESRISGQSTWYNSTTGAADAEIQFGVDVDDAANDYYARVGIDYSDAKSLKLNASGSLADNHLTVGQGAKGVGIGTSTWGTNAVNVLAIYNGTAPSSSPANMVQLYANDVTSSSKLRLRDEAGNDTVISPHDFGGHAPSEPLAWAYHSTSAKEKKSITVDMLRVVRVLEQLSGEQLAYIEEIA